MKSFFKFIFFCIVLVAVGIGFLSWLGWPIYLRDPAARMIWDDGQDRGRGAVYWKPFSDQYIAEIDQGSDFFVWASVDRDQELVSDLKTPGRLGGLILISKGEIRGRGYNEDEGTEAEPLGDWQYLFSSKTVTFENGLLSCKIEF